MANIFDSTLGPAMATTATSHAGTQPLSAPHPHHHKSWSQSLSSSSASPAQRSAMTSWLPVHIREPHTACQFTPVNPPFAFQSNPPVRNPMSLSLLTWGLSAHCFPICPTITGSAVSYFHQQPTAIGQSHHQHQVPSHQRPPRLYHIWPLACSHLGKWELALPRTHPQFVSLVIVLDIPTQFHQILSPTEFEWVTAWPTISSAIFDPTIHDATVQVSHWYPLFSGAAMGTSHWQSQSSNYFLFSFPYHFVMDALPPTFTPADLHIKQITKWTNAILNWPWQLLPIGHVRQSSQQPIHMINMGGIPACLKSFLVNPNFFVPTSVTTTPMAWFRPAYIGPTLNQPTNHQHQQLLCFGTSTGFLNGHSISSTPKNQPTKIAQLYPRHQWSHLMVHLRMGVATVPTIPPRPNSCVPSWMLNHLSLIFS